MENKKVKIEKYHSTRYEKLEERRETVVAGRFEEFAKVGEHQNHKVVYPQGRVI